MKTLITRTNRNTAISLLHLSGVSSRLGEAIITRPKIRKQVKVPELRIVSEVGTNDLFTYATVTKTSTGLWETIVYAGLALSAVGALVVAFGI
jgi:hypothetical protein